MATIHWVHLSVYRVRITLSLLLIACIKFSDFEQAKFSVY